MTTLQLAHHLARHTRQSDLSLASAAAKMDILLAINAGLQTVYSRMPSAHRTTTITATLRAPATVAVRFAAQYTNLLIEPAFSAAQRGCTVTLPGDASANEVVAANAVLDEYLGTTLTGDAQVYGDAVPIYDVLECLTSKPVIFKDGEQKVELAPYTGETRIFRIGKPTHFTLIPLGSSQGANPEFYLRVWPLPDVDYKIRFNAELSTVRVTFPQITQTPVDLPINDHLAESVLLPICREKLLVSPEWRGESADVRAAAQQALAQLQLVPSQISPGFNTVGTREGF